MPQNKETPFKGMTVFRTPFMGNGTRLLLEAEQPATLNLIKRILEKKVHSSKFGGATLMAYGYAVNEIKRLIQTEGFPFVQKSLSALDGRFDAALVGIEPTPTWTQWCIHFAELHAHRLYIDLDGIQAVGSEALRGRDPRWYGLVSSQAVGNVWAARGLVQQDHFIVTGVTASVPPNEARRTTREKLRIPRAARVLLYIGLVSTDFPEYPGMQLETLKAVLDGVAAATLIDPIGRYVCLVRPHPRASVDVPAMHSLASTLRSPHVQLVWDEGKEASFEESVLASDIVACMPTSNFVTQAPYFGRKALLLAVQGTQTGELFLKLFPPHEHTYIARLPNTAVAHSVGDIAHVLHVASSKPRHPPTD